MERLEEQPNQRTALRAAQPSPAQAKAARRMEYGGRKYAAFAEVI